MLYHYLNLVVYVQFPCSESLMNHDTISTDHLALFTYLFSAARGSVLKVSPSVPSRDTSSNARFLRNQWVFYIPVLYFGVVMWCGTGIRT